MSKQIQIVITGPDLRPQSPEEIGDDALIGDVLNSVSNDCHEGETSGVVSILSLENELHEYQWAITEVAPTQDKSFDIVEFLSSILSPSGLRSYLNGDSITFEQSEITNLVEKARAAVTEGEQHAIKVLIQTARATFNAFDNSEQTADDDAIVSSEYRDDVEKALDELEALPNDRENIYMTGPAAAEWALRRLATPAVS